MPGRKLLPTSAVAVVLATAAIVGACGREDATTGPDRTNPADFASNVRLVSGDQQVGAAGAALGQQIEVRVVDPNGTAVTGAAVTFAVRAGGGAVTPPGGVSDANGIVRTTWTLGTRPGANTIVAILTRQFILDSLRLNATATNAPPAIIEYVVGDTQTARVATTLPQRITVKIKDQFGNIVPGATVSFTTGLNSGTVAPASALTDTTTGIASAQWTLGTVVGPMSARATLGTLTGVNFNAIAQIDTSRVVASTTGGGFTGSPGDSTQISVRVTDRFGNAAAGDTVVWNDDLTNGVTPNVLRSATNGNGVATAFMRLGAVLGTGTLRARILGRPPVPTSLATFASTAGGAFTRVFAGNYFSCGVTTQDRAFCWGFNLDGQLAKGASRVNTNQPTTAVTNADTVAGPFFTFRSLEIGKNHTCGIDIPRRVVCWGVGNAGFGLTAPAFVPAPLSQTSTVAIAAGEGHTCALDIAGRVFCAGENQRAQLGTGAGPTSTSPTQILDPAAPYAGTRWSAVAVGRLHTCAFPRFNPDQDSVVAGPAKNPGSTRRPLCWGDNSFGQLGDSTTSQRTLPTPVGVGALGTARQAFDSTSLVAGANHTCMLTLTDGIAYCWGANGLGQLGRGTASVRDSVMAPVAGTITFTRLFAGENHTCGLTSGGTAVCWGDNSRGQLGIGGAGGVVSTPTAVSGTFSFASLSLGELHTCGIVGGGGSGTTATAGTIYCWGDNEYGQLGIGRFGNSPAVTTPSIAALVRNQR